jgi:hypothetical protein
MSAFFAQRTPRQSSARSLRAETVFGLAVFAIANFAIIDAAQAQDCLGYHMLKGEIPVCGAESPWVTAPQDRASTTYSLYAGPEIAAPEVTTNAWVNGDAECSNGMRHIETANNGWPITNMLPCR